MTLVLDFLSFFSSSSSNFLETVLTLRCSITVRPNYNVDGDDGDEEDEFKHWMKDEDE